MLTTDKVLKFLQQCKFDLAREIPGFVDAFMAKDGSAKIVIRTVAPLQTVPKLTFEEEEIPVECSIDFPDAKPNEKSVVITSPGQPQSMPNLPKGEFEVYSLPTETAIGPNEPGARNQKSYEEWQKRHGKQNG
jgi:hypothetical protein